MIDVEGAEIDALMGMSETLKSQRPAVLCEVHWLGEEFLSFVGTHMRTLGYQLTALEGEVPTEATRWHAVLLPSASSS